MTINSVVTALPEPSNTGWGTAGRRIPEELAKVAFVQDLHKVNGGLMLKQDFPVNFNVPLIGACRGVDLLPVYPHVRGYENIGVSFAEDNLLLRKYGPNATRYWDVIACGSTWATEQMKIAAPELEVITAIQGVDTDIFFPNDNVKPDPEWFTIFSGGKMEFRKGIDVVIRAVAVMMERHKDVRLVASWWNPWPASVETMRQSTLIDCGHPGVITNGDYSRILQTNGIKTNFTLLNQSSHKELAYHMNRCDVGVFPNRCEAGTNLVLMEAMACGMPVIATDTHGHADVVSHLSRALRPVSTPFTVERGGMAVAEWYEPDLDEVIGSLETVYLCQSRRIIFSGNSDSIKPFSWAATAKSLLEAQ